MLSLVRATFGKPHYHKYSPFFYFCGSGFPAPFFVCCFPVFWIRFLSFQPECTGGRCKQPSLPFWKFPCILDRFSSAVPASSVRFGNFYGRPLQTAFLIFLEILLYIGPEYLRLCGARYRLRAPSTGCAACLCRPQQDLLLRFRLPHWQEPGLPAGRQQ